MWGATVCLVGFKQNVENITTLKQCRPKGKETSCEIHKFDVFETTAALTQDSEVGGGRGRQEEQYSSKPPTCLVLSPYLVRTVRSWDARAL